MAVVWGISYFLGVVFEVAGLALAAVGIRTTWRANAQGEQLTAPARDALKRAGWWLNAHLPRPLRLSRHVTVHVGSAKIAVQAHAAAVGTSPPAPLSPDLTTEEALAELDRRIRKVSEQWQGAEHAIHRRLEELTRQVHDQGVHIAHLREQIGETARVLRVEGLRSQASGLGLLALGLALQSVGQIGM